jgi:hypothetical protein
MQLPLLSAHGSGLVGLMSRPPPKPSPNLKPYAVVDLSFLPEPVTDEQQEMLTEKGARRFGRLEQCLLWHLADPDRLCSRLQGRITPTDSHLIVFQATVVDAIERRIA